MDKNCHIPDFVQAFSNVENGGLLFVCLSFSYFDMALSVYFRFMSLNDPLVFFAPLLYNTKTLLHFIAPPIQVIIDKLFPYMS